MKKIKIYKFKKGVNLPPFTFVELPQYSNIPKYSKFKNFLENNMEKIVPWPTCDVKELGALEVDDNFVLINLDKCISCFSCIASRKKLNKLVLSIDSILQNIIPGYNDLKEQISKNDIFSGELIIPPKFSGIKRRIKSLIDFTSENETCHISIWSTILLNFLSSDENSRMGKEIEILKMEDPRDGRLDVCVISNETVFVGETKVNLDSLLSEDRYRIQVPSYEKECNRIISDFNKKYNKNLKLIILLIVGGRETDLLPFTHPRCTSKVGNKSNRFYENLTKFNIKFISANAIWAMMLRTLILKKKLCWDKLFDKIFSNEKTIGIVSSGVIGWDDDEFIVKNVPKSFLNFAEQAFF